MATLSLIELRDALLTTAARIRSGARYQWGHFGACNCGHLAQTLTTRSQAEIHRAAIERSSSWGMAPVDDWADAAVEYCPASGLPLDDIIGEMLDAGLTLQQIGDLERLSDRRILRRLPEGRRHLRRNSKDDLALYLETWAQLLAEEHERAAASAELPLAAE